MTPLAFAAAVLAFAIQEEPVYRERVEDLVARLEADPDDAKTIQEIGSLPASLAPLVRERAPEESRPKSARKLRDILPPDPWHRIFRTSIGASAHYHKDLFAGRSHDRGQVMREALRGLACLAPADSRAILDTFAAGKDPALREFAAWVDPFLHPKPGEKYGRLLASPVSCDRAADLILATGETSAIPQAVDLFCRGDLPEAAAAARVLEAFGAGESVNRILGLLESRTPLAGSVIKILSRTGGDKVADALTELLGRMTPGSPEGFEIVRVLQVLGSPDSVPVVGEYLRMADRVQLSKTHPPLMVGDLEFAKDLLADIRQEVTPFEKFRLRQLHRYAYPGLRDAVRAWASDPAVKPSELKHLLPLLGAVGDKADAALLLEKLGDGRCADGAAEGLAMLGDPAHARAVFKAFHRGSTLFLKDSLAEFPPASYEADLVAHISGPQALRIKTVWYAALGPTPEVRKALLEQLAQPRLRSMAGWDVPLLIGAGKDETEKALIEKIRASTGPFPRAFGNYMAMRQGDPAAAAALARDLSTHEIAATYRNERNVAVWSAFESAGEIWMKAVEEEWKAKPDWAEGTLAMARWGRKEALERIRGELENPMYRLRPHALRALARHGDGKAREWLFDQVSRQGVGPRHAEDPLLELVDDPEIRSRMLILARFFPFHGNNRVVALLAERAVPEGLPLYRLGTLQGSVPCLRALFRLKDPAAFEMAVRALHGGDAYARGAAVRLLEELGDAAATPHLLTLVDDMEHASSGIGPLDEKLGRISVAAMAALEKVTGVSPPASTGAERRAFWRDWHAKNHRPGK